MRNKMIALADLVCWIGLFIALWIGPAVMVKVTITIIGVVTWMLSTLICRQIRAKDPEWDL